MLWENTMLFVLQHIFPKQERVPTLSRADLKQFYSVLQQSTNSIELEDISPYSNRFRNLLLDNLSADDTQVLIEDLVLDKFWPNRGVPDEHFEQMWSISQNVTKKMIAILRTKLIVSTSRKRYQRVRMGPSEYQAWKKKPETKALVTHIAGRKEKTRVLKKIWPANRQI